jgi:chromosome segregation ATPase
VKCRSANVKCLATAYTHNHQVTRLEADANALAVELESLRTTHTTAHSELTLSLQRRCDELHTQLHRREDELEASRHRVRTLLTQSSVGVNSSSNSIAQLRRELVQSRAQAESLKDEIALLKIEASQRTGAVAVTASTRSRSASPVHNRRAQQQQRQGVVDGSDSDSSDAGGAVSGFFHRTVVADLTAERDALATENKQLRSTLQRSTCAATSTTATDATASSNSSFLSSRALQRRVTQLESELEQAAADAVTAATAHSQEVVELRAQLQSRSSGSTELRKALERAEAAETLHEAAKRRHAALQQRVDTSAIQAAQLKTEVTALRGVNARLQEAADSSTDDSERVVTLQQQARTSADQVRTLETEVHALQADVQSATAAATAAQAELRAVETAWQEEVEQLRHTKTAAQAAVDTRCSDLSQQLSEATSALQVCEQEHTAAVSELQQQIEQLTGENAHLKKTARAVLKRISKDSKLQSDGASAEAEQAQFELSELAAAYESQLQQLRSELASATDAAHNEGVERGLELAAAHDEVAATQQAVAAVQKALDSVTTSSGEQIARLEAALTAATAESAVLSQEFVTQRDELEAACAAATAQVEQLQQALVAAESERTAALADAATEQQQLQSTVDKHAAVIADFEQYVAEMTEQLQAADDATAVHKTALAQRDDQIAALTDRCATLVQVHTAALQQLELSVATKQESIVCLEASAAAAAAKDAAAIAELVTQRQEAEALVSDQQAIIGEPESKLAVQAEELATVRAAVNDAESALQRMTNEIAVKATAANEVCTIHCAEFS